MGWRTDVLIESSDQIPRHTVLKRFPLPKNLGLDPWSRVGRGRTWPVPAGATHVRRFEIYRYDPESGENPRIDTYTVDLDGCGPMVLDALFHIKNEIDQTLTFRRSCREGVCGSCAMNIDGSNWLACVRRIAETADPVRIYPLNNLRIIRDLVPDLTPLYDQVLSTEPWLKAQTPPPERERLQHPDDAEQLNGKDGKGPAACILCFCCTAGCPSHWWNGDRFLGPAALLAAWRWLADTRDEARPQRLDELEDPFRLYRCHTILNCTRTCPKGLNPGEAIGSIKRMLALRGR